MKILVSGGAGFVGSHLCKSFKEKFPKAKVVAMDNLKRRGSENNLSEFKKRGIDFVHGDVRYASDFDETGSAFDVVVEASAEPSVHAGQNGGLDYLFDTNLLGTKNALEFARKHAGQLLFLSTSRVYSIEALKEIRLRKAASRFEAESDQSLVGVSAEGVREDFSVDRARSFYGMTKLASEYLIQEYVYSFNFPALINRCGVLAGPGQFGKVDQGVFTLWVANHHFQKPLKYTGFGGEGHQVRDLLHPQDLFSLLLLQIESLAAGNHFGSAFNVGGGPGAGSVSMRELTALCQEATGKSVPIAQNAETAKVDIPWYISDNRRVCAAFPGWKPTKKAKDIVGDIAAWIRSNEAQLRDLF